MKKPMGSRLRTGTAGLTIVALLGTAIGISAATAVASKKTTNPKKTPTSSSGLNRQAKSAAFAPLGKSKSSGKSGASAKPKRHKKSTGINKGLFALEMTANGRMRTLKSPSAAVTTLRRAAAAKRRADKSGKADDTFKAVINLNGVRVEFTDPAAAEDACRELVKILLHARKERIFLGDIGQIEVADMVGEDTSGTSSGDSTATPKAKTKRRRVTRKQKQKAAAQAAAKRLAAQRTVQLRINMKIQLEVRKNRGRRLSRTRVRQIVQAEIERARQDGLLPAATQDGGFGAAGGRGRASQIEAYRHELGRAFATGKRLDATN